MSESKLLGRIAIDPGVMVGKPVIRGTRLTVEYVLNLLAHGSTFEEILREYDELTPEDIQACLLFATRSLESTDFMPLGSETIQVRFIVDECTGRIPDQFVVVTETKVRFARRYPSVEM